MRWALLTLFALPAVTGAETTLHVAPDGDDGNPGTAAAPFRTPERARDVARGIDGPVTVTLADGVYRLAGPFVLTPDDSRANRGALTFAAAPGARPILSGGRPVTGWRPTDVDGRQLWVADLPEVRAGDWNFHQLWVNGQRRTRARHPNDGVLRIAELPDVTADTPRYPGQKRFRFREGDIRRYDDLAEVDVVVLHLWVAVRMAVEDVDEADRMVTFLKESRRTLKDGRELARYYVENAFELLDAPGEWYLNRRAGKLYYMPMPGESIAEADAVAPVLPQVVRIQGDPANERHVEDVHFRGLTFAHADWWPARTDTSDSQASVDALAVFHADGARNCSLQDCRVRHASGYGIHLARGCSHNRIVGCEVNDLGAGGVRLGETAVRPDGRDRTHSNLVEGCHLHDLGEIFHQAVGVWIGQSSANRVAGNHVHDLYYTGLSCGWTWGYGPSLARDNVFEGNHVHDIGKGLLSDMGGIYTLGTQPGTVIRDNVFHDIAAYSYGGWGIYFDEGSTDIVAERNLVHHTTDGGFHQHYGKDNLVRDNVFAFGRDAQIRRTRIEAHRSFRFERNIVYWDSGTLLAGNWNEIRAEFDDNTYWPVGGAKAVFVGDDWEKWQEKGMDRKSRIADPMFADPGANDFRLRDVSPALRAGFVPGSWGR